MSSNQPQLPKRPDPFDSVVGEGLDLPWAEYSRGPRQPEYLGTVYWSWTMHNERQDHYYLHRARRHWVLWIRVPDEWEQLRDWMPVAYVLRKQACREEAAIHLVVDFLRFLRDGSAIEGFHGILQGGFCRPKAWNAIGEAVWPPDWKPPQSEWESKPYEEVLKVPTGEEQRVHDVVNALLDKDFDWQQLDLRPHHSSDESSVARALDSIDAARSSTIASDAGAIRLLKSLAVAVGQNCTPDPYSDTRPELPSAKCSIREEGALRFRAEDNRGTSSHTLFFALDHTLPIHYEQTWTTEADKRLRAYLARPGYKISRDGGMDAIYQALTGRAGYGDRSPKCMSYTIGRWIVEAGQVMPDALRDSPAWRELLPRAMRTDPKRDQESLDILVKWVWSTVLPTLQPVADKYDVNAGKGVRPLVRSLRLSYKWKRLLEKRKNRWANLAVSSIDRAINALGGDDDEGAMFPVTLKTGQTVQFMAPPACEPVHDDDLLQLRGAAKAVQDLIARAGDTRACVESAAEAARAAIRSGVEWNVVDPIGLLRRMVEVSGRSS